MVIEIGSRRILHTATTSHPTAEWTTQQLREALPADHSYRFLLHDRDSIFSADLDATAAHLGQSVGSDPHFCTLLQRQQDVREEAAIFRDVAVRPLYDEPDCLPGFDVEVVVVE